MSTQTSGFPPIPFSVASQSFQNVRLLEVPDELLEIITNTQQNIYLKSAPILPALPPLSSYHDEDTEIEEGSLHLCTDDKVWAVKQVSTSNSIYVSRLHDRGTATPRQSQLDEGDADMNDANGDKDSDTNQLNIPPTTALSAFAKPTSFLELHAIKPDTAHEKQILDLIGKMIPTISSLTDFKEIHSRFSLSEVYTHIPAPTSLITRLLSQKCAFEVSKIDSRRQRLPRAYIPASALLLSTWTAIMEASLSTSTSIEGVENANMLDGPADSTNNEDTDDDEETHTKRLHSSICQTLFKSNGHLTTLGIQDSTTGKLNQRECARWVGNVILEDIDFGGWTLFGAPRPPAPPPPSSSQWEGSSVEKSRSGTLPSIQQFEKKWEDSVPTEWMKFCSVEVLRPACDTASTDGAIGWRPFVLESKEGDGDVGGIVVGGAKMEAGATTTAGASKGGKNKRKWHEKFASQRSVKK